LFLNTLDMKAQKKPSEIPLTPEPEIQPPTSPEQPDIPDEEPDVIPEEEPVIPAEEPDGPGPSEVPSPI
jgi:hypothetical protein